MILTMHHSGEQHQNEHYSGVEIGEGSIIYAGAIILPGAVVTPKTVIKAGSVYTNQEYNNL
jgi:acetyltransferase-like isoleucine patch superfamily enzyme